MRTWSSRQTAALADTPSDHGRWTPFPGRAPPCRDRSQPLHHTTLYSPLAGGLLTGKHRQGDADSRRIARPETTHTTAVLDTVLEIADGCDASAAQVSVAWLRGRAAHSATALIPVVGARTTVQLDGYLTALGLDLSQEQYDRLERVSAVAHGTPHEAVAGALPGSSAATSASCAGTRCRRSDRAPCGQGAAGPATG
ncbi:aldo/keto reductase [Streptomyces werraensis]|uniref:aldo/keto reductase n=1 Tax=Streptomyces werraensis TaxID=68284 RepID=UPI001CE2CD71